MRLTETLRLKRSYFLWLLPLFFVLHGFTENFPVIGVGEAVELWLWYSVVAMVLFGLSWLFLRSLKKAAFFAFFLLAFQLLFGAVHDTLKGWMPNLVFSKYSFLLIAAAATFVWLAIYLRKTRALFHRPTIYLNTVLLLLIGVDAVVLLTKIIGSSSPVVGVASATGVARPNIYLIILDEYAGRAQLTDLFRFDNSAFEQELAQRGFQTINHPSSNYNYTPYSMASLFNMGYIDGINTVSSDFNNRKVVFDRINHNRVEHILGGMGYRFVNCSLFDFAGKPPLSQHSEFYLTGKRILSSQTFTSRLRRDLWYHLIIGLDLKWAQNDYLNTLKKEITKAAEQTIKEASDAEGPPKFVYTHFIMPHYPYLYNEAGKELGFKEAIANSETAYLNFLKYANKFSLHLVDTILQNDKTKPIVILMSDHGYTKYDANLPRRYNFNNIINVCNAAPLPDSLTNVNLFRALLNTNFNTQLPMVKDSTVYLSE